MFTIEVAPDQAQRERIRARSVLRDRLREFLYHYSTLPRVQLCRSRKVVDGDGVPVLVGDDRAWFANLQNCASVHSCPTCSAKIRAARATEIERLLDAHDATAGGSYFVTFKVRHDRGQRLEDLYELVQNAWWAIGAARSVRAQRLRARYGFVGFVRALETTVGSNGWHPHLHVLWLTERPLSGRAQRALRNELAVLWAESVGGAVERSRPDVNENGVDLRPVRRAPGGGALPGYMVGMEMARTDLKEGDRHGHRSASRVLRDAMENGDCDDLALWWEYERASKGRRALTWSRGLKRRYAIDVETDEELAAREEGGTLVATVSSFVWPTVCRTRGFRTEIKRVAVDDGADGVNELLARFEAEHFEAAPAGATVGAQRVVVDPHRVHEYRKRCHWTRRRHEFAQAARPD